MFVFTIILQLIVTIAVIVFILHTVRVHRHINDYIKSLEKILKDHEVYLTKEIEFRDSISETINRCNNILNLWNNSNLEVVSKLRNSNKDKDNKFNLLVDKLKGTTKLIEDIYTMVLAIHNDDKNKAKFSYNTDNLMSANSFEKERDTKLKTAKRTRFTGSKNGNKNNQKKQ